MEEKYEFHDKRKRSCQVSPSIWSFGAAAVKALTIPSCETGWSSPRLGPRLSGDSLESCINFRFSAYPQIKAPWWRACDKSKVFELKKHHLEYGVPGGLLTTWRKLAGNGNYLRLYTPHLRRPSGHEASRSSQHIQNERVGRMRIGCYRGV